MLPLSERRARRRRARDMHRRLAELDRIDRLHGLGASPLASRRMATAGRAGRSRAGLGTGPLLVLTAVLTVLVVLANPFDAGARFRDALGLGHRTPLIDLPRSSGEYRFEMLQLDGRTPVTYNPCEPIHYTVSSSGAPDHWEDLVHDAVATISTASGFELVYDGVTSEEPTTDSGQRLRGGQAAPVLIGWGSEDDHPDLGGRVAGVGGSVAVETLPGHRAYVTGSVVLDRDWYDDATGSGRTAIAQAVLVHELGHVIGLGHVDDSRELMHDENVGQTQLGPGDRQGLARLGRVRCG